MSHGKKSKSPKDHKQPKPIQGGCQQEPPHHSDIRGAVEISRSPSLRDEHPSDRAEETARRNRTYNLEKWALGLSGVAALFTLLIFFANKKAADSAADANRIAREALESVQGATITIKGFGYTQDSDAKKFGIDTVFENGGSTQTRKFRTHVSYDARQDDFPEGYSFPDLIGPDKLVTSQTVVGPKAISIVQSGNIFPMKYAEGVAAHQIHLFVYGWAAYRDIFKQTPTHLLEFCSDVKATKNGSGNPPWALNFTGCPQHNCYDEDCKDHSEMVSKIQ